MRIAMAMTMVLASYTRARRDVDQSQAQWPLQLDCTDGDKMPSEHEAQAYQMQGRSLR